MGRPRLPRDPDVRKTVAAQKLVRRKISHQHRLFLEFLEQRLLLSQDVWTGGGDGKTWQDGHNWSLSAAPGSGDTALINVSNGLTITYNGTSSIESVTDNASLDITGGTLTVTSGTSQVSGAFTIGSNATILASGAGTTFTATGAATINGSNVFASGGALIAFPTVTTLSRPDRLQRLDPGQRHQWAQRNRNSE